MGEGEEAGADSGACLVVSRHDFPWASSQSVICIIHCDMTLGNISTITS